MSEFSQISRLQEENRKALLECQQQLHTCERFKQDYEKLEELLQTLPNKTTHEVMVPFGSVAFMPGKLIHTNEIMVLLGDNWFAERSASQALEIVARRKKYLENNIAGINEDLKGFESRIKFASEIQSAAEENSDMKEIKEELSPQEEQRLLTHRSRRAHPKAAVLGGSKKVTGFKTNFRYTLAGKQKEAQHLSSEESSLFARLDELEEKETKNDELDHLWHDDSDNKESKVETGFKKRENDTISTLAQSESINPDVKEIKEELSPQEEQRLLNQGSRKAHSKAAILGGSKRVEGFKSNLQDGLQNKEKEARHMSSEELSLFARLDELEEKEAKNAELDQLWQDDSDYEQSKAESGVKKTEDITRLALAQSESTNQTKKKVTWKTLESKSDTVVNWNDSSGSEGDDDDDDDEDVQRTISVRFSSAEAMSSQRQAEKQLSQQTTAITTPADIYSQFTPKQELKSILRKTSVEEKENKISLEDRKPPTQQLPTNISKESKEKDFNPQKAFTGTIVEKPATQKSEQASSQMSTCQPEKKLSKFKAARQKQQ